MVVSSCIVGIDLDGPLLGRADRPHESLANSQCRYENQMADRPLETDLERCEYYGLAFARRTPTFPHSLQEEEERHVELPVQTISDAPMTANSRCEFLRCQEFTQNIIPTFDVFLVITLRDVHRQADRFQARQTQ